MLRKLILISLLSVFVAGCTSHPVLNLESERIPVAPTGQPYTVKQVEKAIISGTQRRGWSPQIVAPGHIEASISVRSHRATVNIYYNEKNYSILYKDSYNLDYRNGSIHRNYNNWIVKLSRTIQNELGVNSQNY